MPEEILIGTRGWDYDEWTGGFYPEELPSDWRFAYYSNHFRSVLVPQATWEKLGVDAVQDWLEDCDPEFRFVVELPSALARPAAEFDGVLRDFLTTIVPMAAQTAGLLLPVSAESAPADAWLDRLLAALGPSYPICIELPSSWRTQTILACLKRHDAGLCWYPDKESIPRAGGRLMIALSQEGAARKQRQIIEQLAAWQGDNGLAGLFFGVGKAVAEQARQARLIAELMGK